MRFRKYDGWTKEILESYIKRSHLKPAIAEMETVIDGSYYIAECGTIFDVDKLYNDGHVGEVFGKEWWGETRQMSDLEALKSRNW